MNFLTIQPHYLATDYKTKQLNQLVLLALSIEIFRICSPSFQLLKRLINVKVNRKKAIDNYASVHTQTSMHVKHFYQDFMTNRTLENLSVMKVS